MPYYWGKAGGRSANAKTAWKPDEETKALWLEALGHIKELYVLPEADLNMCLEY